MSARTQTTTAVEPSLAAPPQPAEQARQPTLGRQCAGGCGAHMVCGTVCDACRRQHTSTASTLSRAAVNHVPGPVAPAPSDADAESTASPASPTATPAAPQQRNFAEVRTSAGLIVIRDSNHERAEATRRLLERLATHFGLGPERFEIRVDEEAARRTNARGAGGLMEGGAVYLNPQRYHPRTHEGAYLLGHETTHVAQRANAAARDERRLVPAVAEQEARRIGREFAEGRVVERPQAALPVSHAAFDIGSGTAAHDALAVANHPVEIARIYRLLDGWWVSDGDVTEILTILSQFPFVTARALFQALPEKQQYDFINNLNPPHYKPFRTQILAAYWGTSETVLKKFGAKLLTPLQLNELQPVEILAVSHVLQYMDATARKQVREDRKVGPIIQEIEEFTNKDSTENIVRKLENAWADALKAGIESEVKIAKQRIETSEIYAKHENELKPVVDWIKEKLSEIWVSDDEVLEILDRLAVRFLREPAKLRAIADNLVETKSLPEAKAHKYKEKDYLDELIRQTPIKKLFVEGDRRRVFLQLLSFRQPSKNEAIAEELISTNWFLPPSISSPVSAQEAYLAFLLVKALPPQSRVAFFASEGGKKWTTVFAGMSLQMRESETLNLYTGGEEGKDRESILIQLLNDDIWNAPDTSHLDGIIRMAIAAGEHEFVFEQSRQREAYKGSDSLKALVDKYELYNPSMKREKYKPEVLDEDADPSRFKGFLRTIFGSDKFTDFKLLGGVEVGVRGLPLADAQDVMGGSFLGLRLTKPEKGAKKEKRQKGKPEHRVNYADVNYHGRQDYAELHASKLDIAAIHFPIDEKKLQAGRGFIRDINLRIRASDAGFSKPEMLELRAAEVSLTDVLYITPDSMKAVNTFNLLDLYMTLGQAGADFALLEQHRQNPKGPPPVMAGVVQVMYSYFSPRLGQWDASKSKREALDLNLPLRFDITVGSFKLVGLTTSGGQFIESIEVNNLTLRGGGDAAGYRDALLASAVRLKARLEAEEKAFDEAQKKSDVVKMSEHWDATRQLQRQLDRTNTELERLKEAEAEVMRLRQREWESPKTFTAADRIKLRRLQAALSGAVLDAGSIVIKGVAGYEAATPEGVPAKREIRLNDVHGQGAAISSALGTIADPGQWRALLGGGSARATYAGEAKEQAEFVLDIGHVEIPNLLLKGEIPSAKTARKDLQKFEYKPWRPSHVEELKRLERRLELAIERDHLRNEVGLARLDETQRKRFSEVSKELDELEKKGAITVGLIVGEGTTLEFSPDGAIGGGFETLTATDIRAGTTRVARVTGENVHIGVEVNEGLGGLDKWRSNLQKLTMRSDKLVATGITNEELGFAIDSASLNGIDEASLDNKNKNATARLKTKMMLIEGVHLKNIEDALRRELKYWQDFIGPPTESQLEHRESIEASLEELKNLRLAVGKAEAKLLAAKTKQAKQAAQAAVAEAQKKLDGWAEQLITKRVAITDTDLALSGLGDIFAEDWELDEALEKGLQLDGRIEDITVEGLQWQDAARSIKAVGKVSVTGINVVGGFYSKKQIKVGSLVVGSLTGEQVVYTDKASGLEVTVVSGGFGDIKLNDIVIDLSRVEKMKLSGGNAVVGKINQLSLGLKLASKGIEAKGVLNGSNLSVQAVNAGKRVYSLGDLSLTGGRFTRHKKGEKLPDNILVSFKGLGVGKVTEEELEEGGRKLTFEDIKLADLTVGQSRITDGNKSLEINGSASLSGLSLTAEVILDKENKPTQLLIKRLYVEEISATSVRAVMAAVKPDPTKQGDKGSERKELNLESAKIKGLELADLDFAKGLGQLTGTITVKDSVAINKLRLDIGEKGQESLKLSLSTKVFGKGLPEKKGEEGLRGRELKATLLGPGGYIFNLGTFEKISGDVTAYGEGAYGDPRDKLTTAFKTGTVFVGPVTVAADGSRVAVEEVVINAVSLTKPTFTDKKGMEIEITSNVVVPQIKLSSLVATFDVKEEKGRKTSKLSGIVVKDLDFDKITATGFKYTGTTTISNVKVKTPGGRERSEQKQEQVKLSAASATLNGLHFSLLAHDFGQRLTTIKATLKGATANTFVRDVATTLGGRVTQTKFLSNIDAGEMEADLKLKGVEVDGKPQTTLDGFFRLTDPKKGLGLTNIVVTETTAGGTKQLLGALDPGDTAHLNLVGLKARFHPDGTIIIDFHDLVASNIAAEIDGVKIGLVMAQVQDVVIGSKGKGLDDLGAALTGIKVKGLKATQKVVRGAKSTPRTTRGSWVLSPLDAMEGTLSGTYFHNALGRIGLTFPISHGVIDFDRVTVEVNNFPDPKAGIDTQGIYIDALGGVYRKRMLQHSFMEGATPETVIDLPDGSSYISHRGKLHLRQFLEGEMNRAPSPAEIKEREEEEKKKKQEQAEGERDALDLLHIEGSGMKLGGGVISSTSGSVELQGTKTGDNEINVMSTVVGGRLVIGLPGFSAKRADFEALDKPVEVEGIRSDLKFTIENLVGDRSLTINLILDIQNGNIERVNFGDVEIRKQAEKEVAEEKKKSK